MPSKPPKPLWWWPEFLHAIAAKPRPPLVIPVSCLGKDVVAVCDQIRSVDKSRFIKEAGELSKEDMKKLDEGLKVVLSL